MNDFDKAARLIRDAYHEGVLWVRAEHAHDLLVECEALVANIAMDRDVLIASLERRLGEAMAENRRITEDGDRVRAELQKAQDGAEQAAEVLQRLIGPLKPRHALQAAPQPRPRAIRGVR